MASFLETLFPVDISWGATGGPRFRTTIIESGGGQEQRNIDWSQARGEWDVTQGAKSDEQMARLIEFFNAMRGRAHGFRFKDWTDYQVQRQAFAVGDGVETNFQLTKTYQVLEESYERTIAKVALEGTVRVWLDDVLQAEGTDYALDRNTGIVVFSTPPPDEDVLEWEGNFDVPVRFDTDAMAVSMDFEDVNSWQCRVVEIRL